MKVFIATLAALLLTGCASGPMRFGDIRVEKTENVDQTLFRKAITECNSTHPTGGGGFAFGPLPLVAVLAAAQAGVESHRRKQFEECMQHAGYVCTANCETTKDERDKWLAGDSRWWRNAKHEVARSASNQPPSATLSPSKSISPKSLQTSEPETTQSVKHANLREMAHESTEQKPNNKESVSIDDMVSYCSPEQIKAMRDAHLNEGQIKSACLP